MPDDPFLRIGPFATASSLSVKALRAYHESGLLVPAVVDHSTGYRSYAVSQLTDAVIIRQLRSLDVPLEAIRAVLDARDPEVTHKVLAEHGAILQDRLAATQRAMDELYLALETPTLHTPVHVRHEPALNVLVRGGTITGAEFVEFVERTRVLLFDAAQASGAVVAGAYGGCYDTLLDDTGQDVQLYLPVAAAPMLSPKVRATGVSVGELPETDVAVLVHRGPLDTLSETYLQLGAWVAEHGEPADLPVREIYLVGSTETDEPDDYRTELAWPVLEVTS